MQYAFIFSLPPFYFLIFFIVRFNQALHYIQGVLTQLLQLKGFGYLYTLIFSLLASSRPLSASAATCGCVVTYANRIRQCICINSDDVNLIAGAGQPRGCTIPSQ